VGKRGSHQKEGKASRRDCKREQVQYSQLVRGLKKKTRLKEKKEHHFLLFRTDTGPARAGSSTTAKKMKGREEKLCKKHPLPV